MASVMRFLRSLYDPTADLRAESKRATNHARETTQTLSRVLGRYEHKDDPLGALMEDMRSNAKNGHDKKEI